MGYSEAVTGRLTIQWQNGKKAKQENKIVWNMYKVCAAERYALNKQSTNKHKITMWLTKLKYWSKRTVQNITTGLTKVISSGAPEFTPFVSWVL
jgi:hypothetical protein